LNLIVDVAAASKASTCAQCGDRSPDVSRKLRLCSACQDQRRLSEENLKLSVKEDFGLDRSPDLRSCFLKMLLLRTLDLDPSGWRTGLALGYELITAGFSQEDARKILVEAGGHEEKARILMEMVLSNNKACKGAWTCAQLRGMEIFCSGCSQQFHIEAKERIMVIHYPESKAGSVAAV